ncbi:hypothetical protein GCM10020256_41790 [Streptomyces thermocoprophilus]
MRPLAWRTAGLCTAPLRRAEDRLRRADDRLRRADDRLRRADDRLRRDERAGGMNVPDGTDIRTACHGADGRHAPAPPRRCGRRVPAPRARMPRPGPPIPS